MTALFSYNSISEDGTTIIRDVFSKRYPDLGSPFVERHQIVFYASLFRTVRIAQITDN